MVYKGDLEIDPRGLIYESYRIDGLVIEEARSIFLDWAMGAASDNMQEDLKTLLATYGANNPEHPMTMVIKEGLANTAQKGRRGGRSGRLGH